MCRWSFKWVEEIAYLRWWERWSDQRHLVSWLGKPACTESRPMGPAERVPCGHWLEQLQNTKINTTVRAFQTKDVSDPACTIVRALRSAHFATQLALLLQLLQHCYYRDATCPSWRFNWFRQWLSAEQATSHHLNQWDLHTLSLETLSSVTSKLRCYYSDATWASWCFKSPVVRLFVQEHVLANNKANLHTVSLEM